MNLKQLRKSKRLTQQEVANFIGISQNNYSYWENGKVKIDNQSLKKLSELFNVSVDYILGNTNELTPTTQSAVISPEQAKEIWLDSLNKTDKKGIELYLQLNDEDKLKIIGFMIAKL